MSWNKKNDKSENRKKCDLTATLFSSDANCPAGQDIKWNEQTCSPCYSGNYREASDTRITCRKCPYPYTNDMRGGTDEAGCSSKYIS